MTRPFKVGDHVSWNSEAGRVRGRIVKVHTRDVEYKGHTHHASKDEPQYEIESDKTDHVALHKGKALRHISSLKARRGPSWRARSTLSAIRHIRLTNS
jgi:hypothetical protein